MISLNNHLRTVLLISGFLCDIVAGAQNTAGEYYESGSSRMAAKEYKIAIQDFSTAIELEKVGPYSRSSHFQRGHAFLELRDYRNAINDFTFCIAAKPDYFQYCFDRAQAYAGLEILDSAMFDLDRAIELNPGKHEIWTKRGRVKYMLEDFSGAISDCNKATEIWPGCKEAFLLKAKAYYSLGNHSASKESLEELIRGQSGEGEAFYLRGRIHLAEGDTRECCKDWKLAEKNRFDIPEDTIQKYCARFRVQKNDTVITDERDGKIYRVFLAGNTLWMAENLNYSQNEDGRCYNDSSLYCDEFGRLYNYYEANEVCPEGFRLPEERNWADLEILFGMSKERVKFTQMRGNIAEKFLPGGESGFNALFAGYCQHYKVCTDIHNGAFFWTGTMNGNLNKAWSRSFYKGNSEVFKNDPDPEYLLSVRCIKEFKE